VCFKQAVSLILVHSVETESVNQYTVQFYILLNMLWQ